MASLLEVTYRGWMSSRRGFEWSLSGTDWRRAHAMWTVYNDIDPETAESLWRGLRQPIYSYWFDG